MSVLNDYKDCSTAGLRALDLQLIRQVETLAPDALVSFSHLNVSVGSGCHAYLQAPAVRSLELALANRPSVRMKINSAYRTLAQQTVLYSHYQYHRCGITAAAMPGSSNHNTGLAIDIEDAQGWRPYLEKHSWDWLGSWDEMHFDYKDGRSRDLKSLSILAFQQIWNFNYPDKKMLEDGVWGTKTHQCLLSTSIQGFPKSPFGTLLSIPSMFSSLREGTKGADVKRLQQALVKKGILIDVDGNFGESTERAVKKFQLTAGLDTDGVVGRGTAKELGLSA